MLGSKKIVAAVAAGVLGGFALTGVGTVQAFGDDDPGGCVRDGSGHVRCVQVTDSESTSGKPATDKPATGESATDKPATGESATDKGENSHGINESVQACADSQRLVACIAGFLVGGEPRTSAPTAESPRSPFSS
ncbi:hypothetical protein ACFYWX_07800 [Streptomyces sp. NPDC002888]|uniref:hypothetical protein n=1 Tax=Streptomyces sp. NPDC002888 TaxID=3364668 RepID=UPI003683E276